MGKDFIVDFEKIYQNMYTEIHYKDNYNIVLIYYSYAKNKDSIKKMKIVNKHLLIHVDEREYRYGVVVEDGEREYIMPGLICTIYLPLPNNVNVILRWSVKNGTIHVEIAKST